MDIPTKHWRKCYLCNTANVALAITPSKSKGQPVKVPLDVIPATGGQWLASITAGELYAGKLTGGKRDAAEHAGQQLHTSHLETCVRKDDAKAKAIARSKGAAR